MAQIKRIGLVMHEDSAFVRGVLRGVSRYARPGHDWVFRTFRPDTPVKLAIRDWRPHGLITHVVSKANARMVLGQGVPAVDLSGSLDHNPLPQVRVDDVAVGQAAAAYFVGRGFRSLGLVGFARASFSDLRSQGFMQTAQSLTSDSHIARFLITDGQMQRHDARARTVADQRLHQWLMDLPKPAGVLAVNDELGLILTEACREQDIHVPEQVAVLGVDDDDLICTLAHPPLSSIALPLDALGYTAAHMLDELIAGHSPAAPPPLAPLGVRTRQSSDILAIGDPDLASAIRYLRLHAAEPIGMTDLLRELPVSRRSLERRFKAVLGRTFLEELHRIRVDMACELLANTDLPMPTIAQRCGLGNGKQLSVTFRSVRGETPRAFRQRARIGTSASHQN